MASPVPWQLAQPKPKPPRTVDVYARDLYNFSGRSVTQGKNNPVVPIPSMGAHAAGAVNPTTIPTVAKTIVVSGDGWNKNCPRS